MVLAKPIFISTSMRQPCSGLAAAGWWSFKRTFSKLTLNYHGFHIYIKIHDTMFKQALTHGKY